MEPEDTIDYNIRKTWYNISKMYNKTANKYMGSMALGMIILNIDINRGTPSTKLGPIMGMESTSLSRSLKKLEELELIERTMDLKDKRKSVIKLTKKGKKRRELAKKTVLDFNDQVFSYFKKEETDVFFKILQKVNRIIEKINKQKQ